MLLRCGGGRDGRPKVIKIRRDAKILIHAASEFTPSELLHNFAADAKRLANRTEAIVTVIMRRSCQPEPVVRGWLGNQTWLTAEQALAARLVDEVVEPPRLMRASVELPASTMAAGLRRMSNSFSRCSPD